LLQRDQDRYETDRKLHLGKNERHETTLIYRRKEDPEYEDHRQYSVFMTNRGTGHLTEYGYRWEIKSGYRYIKRFIAATTSKDFGFRFSTSHSLACCTRSGELSIYSSRSS
jgi:hypothetical protein